MCQRHITQLVHTCPPIPPIVGVGTAMVPAHVCSMGVVALGICNLGTNFVGIALKFHLFHLLSHYPQFFPVFWVSAMCRGHVEVIYAPYLAHLVSPAKGMSALCKL